MDIQQIIKGIWANRKRRNLLIMSIILLILILIGIVQFLTRPAAIPPGSRHVLMCSDCGKKSVKRIVDKNNFRFECEKCGGKLYMAYKCLKCDFEFCIPPSPIDQKYISRKEIHLIKSEKNKCPNCKSTYTTPFGVKKFLENSQ